jgi:transcriptional regulator with XRE-family HTH domain
MNIKELKKYVESLKSADLRSDDQFKDLLNKGMNLLRLLDSDISREFGVSRPTVNRWRNGANAPHPAMRKPLFEYLAKRTSSLIASEQRTRPQQKRRKTA